MTNTDRYVVRYVRVATGPVVWDDPHADQVVRRFMSLEREHPPMLVVIDLDATYPTARVLQRLVVNLGEDVMAGRYGSCSLVFCSQDEDTRNVIYDIAESQSVAIFLCSTYEDVRYADPVGDLTPSDLETLDFVFNEGGTVNAQDLANRDGIEQTTAGNRLVSLQKKGYVLRVQQPHPVGDLFIDPRSLGRSKAESTTESDSRPHIPNRTTILAIEAACRGDLVELGSPEEALAELKRDD